MPQPNKRTHSQFLDLVSSKSVPVLVLGEYVNVSHPIEVECTICFHRWRAIPNNLLRGHGCQNCARLRTRKKSSDFLEEVAVLHPNLDVLGEYKNVRTSIVVRCKVDNHVYHAKPSNLLKGKGCPVCGGCLKRTQEEFVTSVTNLFPQLEILGNYVSSKTKLKVRCRVHNLVWEPRADLVEKSGCPRCNGGRYLDGIGCQLELQRLFPNIVFMTQVENLTDRFRVSCNLHPYHIWETNANTMFSGHQCKFCSGSQKTKDSFLEFLRDNAPNITLSGKYTTRNRKTEFLCSVCDTQWGTSPKAIINGTRCPVCSGRGFNKSKPSVLYFYQYSEDFLGFGISNQFEKRHLDHVKNFAKYNLSYRLIGCFEGSGEVVASAEKMLYCSKHRVVGICEGFIRESLNFSSTQEILQWTNNYFKQAGY